MEVYTTQMDAARKGIATEQMKTVAEKEHMPLDRLMQLVAEGKVNIGTGEDGTDPASAAATGFAAKSNPRLFSRGSMKGM